MRKAILLSLLLLCSANTLRAQRLVWEHTNGPYSGWINLVAAGSSTLYATQENGIVFRSTDRGETWVLAFDGTSGFEAWAYGLGAKGATAFIGFSWGVMRTTDNGDSWTSAQTGLSGPNKVAIFVWSGDTIFASSRDGGVSRSTNNGDSWTPMNKAITNTHTYQFAVDGQRAITATVEYGNNLFQSMDGGNTWHEIDGPMKDSAIYALNLHGDTLFVAVYGHGLYRSTDNGATWGITDTGATFKQTMVLSWNGSKLFAGARGFGVYCTSDGGSSWQQLDSGLIRYDISAFAFSLDTIYASTPLGVERSTNGGLLWNPICKGFGYPYAASFLRFGDTLIASTAAGAYRTTNNGDSWLSINGGLGNIVVGPLTVSGNTIFAGSNNGVYRSTDYGDSWRRGNPGMTDRNVVALTATTHSIFASTYSGFYRSTDGGNTWKTLTNGISSTRITSLASRGTTVFAGGASASIFRSIDEGDTWVRTHTDANGSDVSRLRVLSPWIYASIGFRSPDDGLTWDSIGIGGNDFLDTGTTLFAAEGGGVAWSSDNGTTWVQDDTGWVDPLIGSAVNVHTLTALGTTLFAGSDLGVFRTVTSGQAAVRVPNSQTTFDVFAQPNPLHDQLIIHYKSGDTKLKIALYDILGNRVLLTKGDASGESTLNVASLPAGMYELMLRSDQGTATRTVMIVH